MVNQDFQELKRQWSVNKENEENIVKKMRSNLFARNNDQEEYTTNYTTSGKVFNINTASVQELFEIDGDMCPQGK